MTDTHCTKNTQVKDGAEHYIKLEYISDFGNHSKKVKVSLKVVWLAKSKIKISIKGTTHDLSFFRGKERYI